MRQCSVDWDVKDRTLDPGPEPSKCHHSPEYTDKPPALIASRNRPRLACWAALTPSVAKAVALGEKSSKSVPMSTRHRGHCWDKSASVTSTERPDSWLFA